MKYNSVMLKGTLLDDKVNTKILASRPSKRQKVKVNVTRKKPKFWPCCQFSLEVLTSLDKNRSSF